MEHNIPLLMNIANELRELTPSDRDEFGPPVIAKIDSTRDLRGSLYALENWKLKHKELGQALEREYKCTFKDNGNSYPSCFQFEGKPPSTLLSVRVKYYWKTLALIQSESVSKSVGMNMKGLFYPSARIGRAHNESKGEGLSRIEITYTANTSEGEDEILNGVFYLRAQIDLDRAERALNNVKNIGWHLPIHDLMSQFMQYSRQS